MKEKSAIDESAVECAKLNLYVLTELFCEEKNFRSLSKGSNTSLTCNVGKINEECSGTKEAWSDPRIISTKDVVERCCLRTNFSLFWFNPKQCRLLYGLM